MKKLLDIDGDGDIDVDDLYMLMGGFIGIAKYAIEERQARVRMMVVLIVLGSAMAIGSGLNVLGYTTINSDTYWAIAGLIIVIEAFLVLLSIREGMDYNKDGSVDLKDILDYVKRQKAKEAEEDGTQERDA
tara:strand:+ start:238 stop:630 length:393 start_codon:yes stop_codon:yes gene_type:complete